MTKIDILVVDSNKKLQNLKEEKKNRIINRWTKYWESKGYSNPRPIVLVGDTLILFLENRKGPFAATVADDTRFRPIILRYEHIYKWSSGISYLTNGHEGKSKLYDFIDDIEQYRVSPLDKEYLEGFKKILNKNEDIIRFITINHRSINNIMGGFFPTGRYSIIGLGLCVSGIFFACRNKDDDTLQKAFKTEIPLSIIYDGIERKNIDIEHRWKVRKDEYWEWQTIKRIKEEIKRSMDTREKYRDY